MYATYVANRDWVVKCWSVPLNMVKVDFPICYQSCVIASDNELTQLMS